MHTGARSGPRRSALPQEQRWPWAPLRSKVGGGRLLPSTASLLRSLTAWTQVAGPRFYSLGGGRGSISGATLAATSPLGKVMNPGHVGLENCKSLGGRAHQLLPETSGECREGHKTESGMASARRQLSGSACSRVLKPGNGSARFPLSPPWWY